MPVLFILGEEDTPLVHRASRASADRIPGAEWVVLSGADHLPQMESMEFDDVVLEFLRR
jgi:pimeloyl-ACP methyl ester carboxylesterase